MPYDAKRDDAQDELLEQIREARGLIDHVWARVLITQVDFGEIDEAILDIIAGELRTADQRINKARFLVQQYQKDREARERAALAQARGTDA